MSSTNRLFIFYRKNYPNNCIIESCLHHTQKILLKNIWKKQGSAKQIRTIIGWHIKAHARNQQWVQSKATQHKQWTTERATTTTQKTTQLLKRSKMEQQQAANIQRIFRKQGLEERMKKLDIEVKIKMRLQRALFERRVLELEMQLKELGAKHQLLV